MSFIHMKSLNPVISKSPEHPHTTDPENHFLTKTIMLISSIKEMGEGSVPLRIFREIRIQKENRHLKIANSFDLISPGPEMNGSPFHGNRDSLGHLSQKVLDGPCRRLLPLPSVRPEFLAEVSLSVEECNRNHRYPEIGCRANGISS